MVDRPRRPQPGEFALGYVRVSTDEQGDNYSLGEQEREIRAFAEREGVVLDAVLSDEHTGSVGVRPGIVRLFERARGRHRWIIVWKGDREIAAKLTAETEAWGPSRLASSARQSRQ